MTANYTKVRTHAKSIEIINEFFQKKLRPTLRMSGPALYRIRKCCIRVYLFLVYSSAFSLARATRLAVSGCKENIFWNLDSFGASADNSNNLFNALYIAYGSILCLMLNSNQVSPKNGV